MNELDFVDTTLRDGHQSLWAAGMRTGMILPVAEQLDRVGFKAIEVISTSLFKKCVRDLKEDPWERIRLVAREIRRTPLAIMMGPSVTTFDVTPLSVMKLYVERLAANGIARVQFMEASNDMGSRTAEILGLMKGAGLQTVVALVYSISPRHTDEYYARKAREAVALRPDAIYLKDPGGLLTPERIRTIVPAILGNAGTVPVELHSHCTTGLAPVCYIEAIKLGIRTLCTAFPPLANGASQPSVFNVANNARLLGFQPKIDLSLLPGISSHFAAVARRDKLPPGVPVEYDVSQYLHHVPGGVISHLRFQLTQLGRADRMAEVLEEIARVHAEFGYPIMVTPFSQFVSSQSALNVMLGERYKQVSDEVIQFALGHWGGEAAAGVNPDVRDRILGTPRARELAARPPVEPSIDEVRRRLDATGLSDDEFILRFIAPRNEIDAMRAAGPPRSYAGARTPLLALLDGLASRPDLREIHLREGSTSIALRARGA